MDEDAIAKLDLPPNLRPFIRSKRFQLLGRMGEGGMGTVYRVHDRELRQDVALKVMRRAGPTALQALKREFRSRAGLSHPHLVQLHDLIVGEDFCCFSMELVEGMDFLSWVCSEPSHSPRLRASGAAGAEVPLEEEVSLLSPEAVQRLRSGLAQLLRGLRALHEAGFVHRDIKPANVLVTPAGRVVIVDFGLAAEFQADFTERGGSSSAVGTLPYMSPEQLRGGPLAPASDLYAVGLMLYEALTGLRPFQDETVYVLLGDAEHLLERRRAEFPPDPRSLVPGTPDDLADMAMALMAFAPGERPDAASLLDRLRPEADARFCGDDGLFLPPRTRFVGRAAELAVLEEALREVSGEGRQRTVHVHGPSGIGKSTLVREFLWRHEGLCVLKGRCHPQEVVAYRSLDPVIDALASHLARLQAASAPIPVPEHAHALVRLFPVLGRVDALRAAPVPASLPADIELRRRGAEALREVLAWFCQSQPVVLWIDDAHWGDADSARLLAGLLRDPDPPAFLLVLTTRDGERPCENPEGTPPERRRELLLGPLAEEEVGSLARQLLEGMPERAAVLGAVAGQAGGNPFVVGEVARYLASSAARGATPAVAGALDINRLLAERLRDLPSPQRALVELAAVAGVPVERGVLLTGAGLDLGARPLLATLCDASLLRRTCGEDAEAVTTYHDRTREAALALLDEAGRSRRHRGLAEALEHAGSEDLELLVVQWEGAGEPRRAGGYAARAADRAAHALAFDQAARLYTRALALLGDEVDRSVLLERLGDALANQGRRAEAAACYLEAAEVLGEREPERVRSLKRRAAEQFIKCGRVEEGWRLLRAVLVELKVPVPRTRWLALASAVWNRLRFLQTHREPEARATSEAPLEERPALEALWTAATSFAVVDPILADAFRMRYLRRVLEVGDASAVCRALAFEVAMETHLQGRVMDRSSAKLLGQVERLARWTGNACDEGWWWLARATHAFTHGQWDEAVATCEQGEAVLRERCTGVTWELDVFAVYFHAALALSGELRRLGQRVDRFLEDSTQRGDFFGIIESCLGDCMLAWLARGQGARAWALARRALEQVEQVEEGSACQGSWDDPTRVGQAQRVSYCLLIGLVHASLHDGRPWRAWQAVCSQWENLYRSTPSLRFFDSHVRHARARAALAVVEQLDAGQAPPEEADFRWTRRALLADARAQARFIGRDPLAMGAPVSALVRAGLARLEGDGEGARRLLAEAVEGFAGADMVLHQEAARYALGVLQGGEEGEVLRRRAEAWLEEQGVVDARAFVATLAPGLGLRGEGARGSGA